MWIAKNTRVILDFLLVFIKVMYLYLLCLFSAFASNKYQTTEWQIQLEKGKFKH